MTAIAVEIALLTPPLGISVNVIKSSLGRDDISLGDIFIGAAPFALAVLVVLILVILVPDISLYRVELNRSLK